MCAVKGARDARYISTLAVRYLADSDPTGALESEIRGKDQANLTTIHYRIHIRSRPVPSLGLSNPIKKVLWSTCEISHN